MPDRLAPGLFLVLLWTSVGPAVAQIDLQELVDHASPGDTLQLLPQRYASATINKALTLVGHGTGTVIDGGGAGHVLALRSPDISVRNLMVTNSDTDVSLKESGIWIDRLAGSASARACADIEG